MTTPDKNTVASALKVLTVLRVLERNFAHGFSMGELAKETGFNPSDITRFVATLEEAGCAERIPETNRIRYSHRMAQVAIHIMLSLDEAERRINEARQRLMRTPI